MKISSFWQQAIRNIQISLAAIACSIVLNFGTACPTLAAQLQAPTPHLALFGIGEGRKVEGRSEQFAGKVQAKTGNKFEGLSKQVTGRAESDIGRVEDAAQVAGDKADRMAKDARKGVAKNISNAKDSMKDTANDAIDSVKKLINK